MHSYDQKEKANREIILQLLKRYGAVDGGRYTNMELELKVEKKADTNWKPVKK